MLFPLWIRFISIFHGETKKDVEIWQGICLTVCCLEKCICTIVDTSIDALQEHEQILLQIFI